MFKPLDKAIQELDSLLSRKIIREFAILLRLFVKARACKGFKRLQIEAQARWNLGTLSDSARSILEVALRCKN